MNNSTLDRFTLSAIADFLAQDIVRRKEIQASDVRDGCMSTRAWEDAEDELEELRSAKDTLEAHIDSNFGAPI